MDSAPDPTSWTNEEIYEHFLSMIKEAKETRDWSPVSAFATRVYEYTVKLRRDAAAAASG
jgi:hypothetical protein